MELFRFDSTSPEDLGVILPLGVLLGVSNNPTGPFKPNPLRPWVKWVKPTL